MAQPLTFATAHRQSSVPWSDDALAFFAGMERAEAVFGCITPDQRDLYAAIAGADDEGTPYPVGSNLHAVKWHEALVRRTDWEGWSRRIDENAAAGQPQLEDAA